MRFTTKKTVYRTSWGIQSEFAGFCHELGGFGPNLLRIPQVLHLTVDSVDPFIPVTPVFPDCTRLPMKTTMRGLTLAAIMLSASSAMADNNDSRYFDYDQDPGQSAVGDLPGYGDEAYYAETASYAEESRTSAARAPKSAPVVAEESNEYQPVSYNSLQPTSHTQHVGEYSGDYIESAYGAYSGGGCSSGSCGSSCDSGSCGSGCGCGSCGSGRIGRVMSGCGNSTWAQAEALLWFPQERSSVPLVSRADGAGSNSALDADGVTVFGNQLGGDLSGGFRGDFGKFITRNVGFGGRFWILGDNTETFSTQSDGANESFGIPFFNTDAGLVGENAVVISGLAGAPPQNFAGEVNAESKLSLFAAEAYGRFRFGSGGGFNLDLIGGYTHFDIEDDLFLNSRRIRTSGAQVGRVDEFTDSFQAENQFDGGQIGFESVMTRGRWMARSLTKVHLGNMNQRLSTSGTSQTTVPGPPDTVTPFSNGIFNSGNATGERDVFTFAPEVNFKLAYRFRPNVLLSAGYTFIYWDNVALAGEQVNRNVDATRLLTNTASTDPFRIVDSSLFVQGVDVGVILDF